MRYFYPAIVGCIGEARSPSFGEILQVAKRVRREIYAGRPIGAARRRRIIMIALAALGVSNGFQGRERRIGFAVG